ncbi:MAG: TolC family protein [Planctomycetes bacterium]|nr:TolC family protein [Planctomycetota bacterium]
MMNALFPVLLLAAQSTPSVELTLEAAYRTALENNLGLRIEAANTEAALYNYRATWGTFDWVVDARLGYSDAEYQPRDVFGGSSETNRELTFDLTRPFAATGGTLRTHFGTTESKTNSSFQVEPRSTTDIISLQYTQPLLRGAWREYATSRQRESQLDSRRQDEQLRQTRQKLLLDVSIAYWNHVAAIDALGVADSSLNLARRQLDQNQRLLDAGMGTTVEVLQAEAGVATREESRLKAEVDVRKAADDLKQLLVPGKDAELWESELVPVTPLPEAGDAVPPPAWETAFSIAVERRPELRRQRLAVQAASVRHDRAKVERRAGLDLDLTASSQGFSGSSSEALETTAQFDFPTYRAALVFNYAIGNTGASNSERAAWASIRAARLSYDDLESKIAAEVRDGVRQVRYQAEAVRAADKSLELAQRQLAAEELRFQNGQSTTFEILKFQTDLAQSMSNARAARANYAKSLATLTSAQGLLGEARGP